MNNKFIFILLLSLILFSCKDDPVSNNADQPVRKVKYAFSGTTFSGPERMTYMIENAGNLVIVESNHSYPYISELYDLRKGDRVFAFAQNTSLISTSYIRIDLIVDNDTVSTNQKTGESPSTQVSKVLD